MNISKRVFDLFWSIIGLVFLSPFFIIIAILIKLEDRGPVFFRQERVGYKGKPFKIYKFRTMVADAEIKGGQLTIGRDPRITRVGYWLRKTKLDELPQLINVLRGEMTLVGPRPEVPKYVSLYSVEQRKVLDLVPGITDPASIQFKDESALLANEADPEKIYIDKIMPEKIRLNLDYAMRRSLWSDIRIIIKTIFEISPIGSTGNSGKAMDYIHSQH